MSCTPHPTKKPRLAGVARLSRRCACYVVLGVCVYVAIHVAVEPFHIPSGSMAPALLGHHRCCICPRCGQETAVGRVVGDIEDRTEVRFYRKAFCRNCGLFPLPVTDAPTVAGDKIIVNKTAYWQRPPRRWEIAVFRLLGTFFIKRILGLPGEQILIHDGDLYVNGRLERKSLAEARSMAMLVFDQQHAPDGGWSDRWESSAPISPGPGIKLNGRRTPHLLTYCNFSLDSRKCEPIRDEYAYNAGLHADSECVHDFLIASEIEVTGHGMLTLRLCDGHDWVEVLLPVGESAVAEAFAWPMARPEQTRKLAETSKLFALLAGQRYKILFAFVDRRLSLAVDGKTWLQADMPEAKKRQGVDRPFQAQADGVQATLYRFQLFRDVHYGQQGNNAVRGKAVRLGANQYFMMGDNSPNSEDSRFWPDEGRVDAQSIVGSVLYVHGSRATRP